MPHTVRPADDRGRRDATGIGPGRLMAVGRRTAVVSWPRGPGVPLRVPPLPAQSSLLGEVPEGAPKGEARPIRDPLRLISATGQRRQDAHDIAWLGSGPGRGVPAGDP